MGDTVQFVDSIASGPTVRLDLNNENPWALRYDGTDLSPPPLQTAWADNTLLTDGAQQVASAYGNRTIRLRLELITATVDQQATALQNLHREMDRPTNFLRWQPAGATNPVFFRTMRSAGNRVTEYPGSGTLRVVDVQIEAEPFGYGLKQSLAPATVYNDPAEGVDLNANPYFETDVSNWTPVGGTFVRSTAHNISAPASGLFTPDGVTATVQVRSEAIATPVGQSVRASAWVWSTVARNVDINIRWTDASDVLISASTVTTALGAGTWTFLDMTATAPANTVFSHLVISMTGTPPASNTIWIDDARLRFPGSVGAMCFDVSSVLGDVETPLYLRVPAAQLNDQESVIAVRRGGTPSNVPFVLQAEAGTLFTDTSLPGNDTAMSGAGNNYVRVSFATSATLQNRISWTVWPNTTNTDIRGTYRVFARARRSVLADEIRIALLTIYNGGSFIPNDTVLFNTANTALQYVDLGLVRVPSGMDPVTDGISGAPVQVKGNLGLKLQAGRATGGTGNVDIDVLVFVPADARLAIVSWPFSAGADSYTLDANQTAAYALDSGGNLTNEEPMGIAGGAPLVSPGVTNRVYFLRSTLVPSGATADSKTATTVVTAWYWPRYLYVRPAST